jgi:hypothetical protein
VIVNGVVGAGALSTSAASVHAERNETIFSLYVFADFFPFLWTIASHLDLDDVARQERKDFLWV